jgi:DNA-binding FadR family transcriptional regulator
VPAGTRGDVLGALVDIEDAIEAGDRTRAREGMRHLRQALDSLPF